MLEDKAMRLATVGRQLQAGISLMIPGLPLIDLNCVSLPGASRGLPWPFPVITDYVEISII